MNTDDIYKSSDIFTARGMCQHCHKRKATDTWVGEGSMMDAIHGAFQYWCKLCVLKAQVAYAEKHVGDLARLRKELKAYEQRHRRKTTK